LRDELAFKSCQYIIRRREKGRRINILRFIRTMLVNFKVGGELLRFLWQRKLWWLIPMVIVLIALALLLMFASTSGMGPFIYTLF
jgi:hypothetical protein